MREIIFRGKRKRGDGFVYGDLSRRFSTTRITTLLDGTNYEDVEVIPETVGQYTGLKDKNGTMIFEGDLVRDHNGIGVVKYSEKDCAFFVSYGNGEAKWFYDYTLSGERESIEVIGNIHEGVKE